MTTPQLEQRITGQRMWRIATELFLLMAALFIACHLLQNEYPELRAVKAFAEAAMVGALADWFAVVALFRRPLGLPIPHTAIVPENKLRIGLSLGAFVRENFLSEETVTNRIASLNLARDLATWSRQEDTWNRVWPNLSGGASRALRSLNDESFDRLFSSTVRSAAESLPLADMVSETISILSEKDRFGDVLDLSLEMGTVVLDRYTGFVRQTLGQDLPWYIPRFVHDHIVRQIVERVRKRLAEMSSDPNHPLRGHCRDVIELLKQELRTSESLRAKVETIKTGVLNNERLATYLSKISEELRTRFIRDLESENSVIAMLCRRIVTEVAAHIESDAVLQQKINRSIRDLAIRLIDRHGSQVEKLISDTVGNWDTKTLIEKIELQVGPDLQYIRINGTLVGGLVGLALYFATKA